VTIYFAASIRGGRQDEAIYAELVRVLAAHGTVLTEHVGNASLLAGEAAFTDREIHDRDLEWLRAADVVVAEVSTPSLGVGYEIGKATEWGKPVVCLARTGTPVSAMIAGGAVVMRWYERVEEFEGILSGLKAFAG
jgi:hypothetical protein